MKNSTKQIPQDGLSGLKENFFSDATAGFVVFLLALPLSLGIAKASDFPPLMGLITAILGGVVVSLFSGSRLTIKGPAAGLIVIVLGSVSDFGGGETGWHLALGAMVVAGLVQIAFGFLRLGRLVDFFPLSAVHGMLAAIGMIIILKQVPILLDVDPKLASGKSPFQLIASIPMFLLNLDPKATLIGGISLWIMLEWQKNTSGFLKKIPAPLVVLAIAIPAQFYLHFQETGTRSGLIHIGSLLDNLKVQVDFSGIQQTGTFVRYVVMFALVGSLESLLVVKAVDMMDPYQRKSNANQDLVAVGIGNVLASIFGGLPMISEVARSSANVSNGAKTRWANFFHGLFLLGFLVLAAGLLEMIPNTALAAMLISVGIKLAHPREFFHIFQIGLEQLAVFLLTIVLTLYTDLLVGISAGILLKILIHLFHGAPVRSLFSAQASVSFSDNQYLLEVEKVALFSNFLGIKSRLEAIPKGSDITVDFSKTTLVDHNVMESILQFEREYKATGGKFQLIGLENHTAFSGHSTSTRKRTPA